MKKTRPAINRSATMWNIPMQGVLQDDTIITNLGSAEHCLSSLKETNAAPFELILSDINLHMPDTTNERNSKLKSPSTTTSITTISPDKSTDGGSSRDADGHLEQPFTLESAREVVDRLST